MCETSQVEKFRQAVMAACRDEVSAASGRHGGRQVAQRLLVTVENLVLKTPEQELQDLVDELREALRGALTAYFRHDVFRGKTTDELIGTAKRLREGFDERVRKARDEGNKPKRRKRR